MDPKNSEKSANYVHTILQGRVLNLKSLLKYIQKDYNNPSNDYISKQCQTVKQLEDFLRNYPHLFIVENEKVTKSSEKLEIGQEIADSFFEDMLKYNFPLSVETLKKHTENAPEGIQYFIKTFYPDTEFKRYLKRRPQLFHVSRAGIVYLTEKDSAEFFKKIIVKQIGGVHFMSLRGNVGQAPEHIRKYINDQYPGTEFKYFLQKNCHIFRINSNDYVFLVI